jgi:hypothetical protein
VMRAAAPVGRWRGVGGSRDADVHWVGLRRRRNLHGQKRRDGGGVPREEPAATRRNRRPVDAGR